MLRQQRLASSRHGERHHPEDQFNWSVEGGLGYLFAAVAFLIGIEPGECLKSGQLLGLKVVANELVAYEARIESVREWPFDSGTLSRFLLYLALPLGSWAGGALVERAIDGLLG